MRLLKFPDIQVLLNITIIHVRGPKMIITFVCNSEVHQVGFVLGLISLYINKCLKVKFLLSVDRKRFKKKKKKNNIFSC